MALQTIDGGGVWIPQSYDNHTIGASTFVLDATGEYAALVFIAPKTGNIDRFDFHVGAVGNSPDNGLRASLQTVDGATGLPTGTLLGATNNAAVTYAHSVTTGWKNTDFAEVAAVTRGQVIAAVIDIPSFTASDNITISRWPTNTILVFPYGISAAGTKGTSDLPVITIHYTDGYACLAGANHPGPITRALAIYNSGTAGADEVGLKFSVPFPCTLDKVSMVMAVAAGANFEVLVYDSDGTSVLSTTTIDGDVVASTSLGVANFVLTTPVSIVANTGYRVTVRPTTANNVTLEYYTFQSLDLMDAMEGGSSMCLTSQINQGGVWTDHNSGTFGRPALSLHLTAFDDGVSGGGGGGARVIGAGF